MSATKLRGRARQVTGVRESFSILLTITQAGIRASRMNRAIHNDFLGRRRRSFPEVFRFRLAISSMEHSVVSRQGIALCVFLVLVVCSSFCFCWWVAFWV